MRYYSDTLCHKASTVSEHMDLQELRTKFQNLHDSVATTEGSDNLGVDPSRLRTTLIELQDLTKHGFTPINFMKWRDEDNADIDEILRWIETENTFMERLNKQLEEMVTTSIS